MDFGRDYAHLGRIFPFRDRPDVGIFVLWYPVPLSTEAVPFPNPFVLRNWDLREGLPQTPLGTDQTSKTLYFGNRPAGGPGAVCGSPDLWTNGLLFSDWLAGNYNCQCQCDQVGIFNRACIALWPTVWNYTVNFTDGQGPFTGEVTWSDDGEGGVWQGDNVGPFCGALQIPFTVGFKQNVATGKVIAFVNRASSIPIFPSCGPPPSITTSTGRVYTCDPPFGPGPVFALVDFRPP